VSINKTRRVALRSDFQLFRKSRQLPAAVLRHDHDIFLTGSADAGVILLQPLTRNLILSTPNKLFECVAVGTPVIVSDLPEMRRIVIDDPDGPLGVVCDPEDDDAIGAALAELVGASADTRAAFRRRCLKAARERLNWESEAAILVGLYDELADRHAGGATAGRSQAG